MHTIPTAVLKIPVPFNESYRRSVLEDCGLLDGPVDPELQRIVSLAARRLSVPIALVSLIDSARQWFVAQEGLADRESPRDLAFCAHTIVESAPLIIGDTLLDPAFCDHPLVVGAPHIRFYAGMPLIVDGAAVGTLCLVDAVPRPHLTPDERADLEDLAELAAGLLRARRDLGADSQIRKAEQEIERTRALALLSHELRTPLNAIIGFAELIADEVKGPIIPPVYRDYAESMRDGGRRLERFAERMLRYTEVASGHVEVHNQRIEARVLAEQAVELVAARAQAAGVALRLAPMTAFVEGLVLKVDPQLLEQALFQVLSNAIEHGRGGGSDGPLDVLLTWEVDAGQASFVIRDTGIGLSQQDWDSVIAPFGCAADPIARGDSGHLGLGLALAKRLVELHSGTLRLDDCEGASGCSIRITLPHWRTAAADDTARP